MFAAAADGASVVAAGAAGGGGGGGGVAAGAAGVRHVWSVVLSCGFFAVRVVRWREGCFRSVYCFNVRTCVLWLGCNAL